MSEANGTLLPRLIVLDTNIVLDVLIFNDTAAEPVRVGLRDGSLHWIATTPMRDELARVLDYPQIAKRVQFYQLTTEAVLEQFDALAQIVPVAAKAPVTCKDADDQKFIDLAVAHQCPLLSKDKAVLCMRKRLLALSVLASKAIK